MSGQVCNCLIMTETDSCPFSKYLGHFPFRETWEQSYKNEKQFP